MINKYNISLRIFNEVTAHNKFFYIGCFSLCRRDKDLYYWIIIKVKKL